MLATSMFLFTWFVSDVAPLALKWKRLDVNVLFCAFGDIVEAGVINIASQSFQIFHC